MRASGLLRLSLKSNMVETAGIEPASEDPLSEGATCLVSVFNLIRWTRQSGFHQTILNKFNKLRSRKT